MDVFKKHKTLLTLWESSFLVYNDLKERDSVLLSNNDHRFNSYLSNTQLQHVIVGTGSLLFSFIKEKMIEKKDDNFSLLIDESKFKKLIADIIKVRCKKVYVDDMEFASELAALDFIRNKLLHGDYYIDDKNIIMKKDGSEFKININTFIHFVLESYDYLNSGSKEYSRYFVLNKVDGFKYDIDTRFDSQMFEWVNIKISKQGKRLLKEADIKVLSDMLYVLRLNACVHNFSFDEIWNYYENDRVFEKYREYFRANKVNVSYEHVEVNDKDLYLKMKKSVSDAFGTIGEKTYGNYYENEAAVILPIMDNIINPSYDLTTNSLKYLIHVLVHYYFNDHKNMVFDLAKSSDSATLLDDVTVAACFVCFYAVFHYGLDNLYSDGRNTNLSDLLTDKKFDFSKLLLDELDDSNMKIEVKCANYEFQAKKIMSDLEGHEINCANLLRQYQGCLSSKNIKKENLERVKENLELASEARDFNKLLVDRLSEFDIDKYERYLNIINHIRNAFAHGTVTLAPYSEGDTLFDRVISIKDIYEGELTYEKELSFRELTKLFAYSNNKSLSDYIYNITSMDNKYFVNRGFICVMNDANNVIKDDKKDDWKELVTQSIDNNDNETLYYYGMFYYFLVQSKQCDVIFGDLYNLLKIYISRSIQETMVFEDENDVQHNPLITEEKAFSIISGLIGEYSKITFGNEDIKKKTYK